jgi:antitoxin (DNA-binding transcriptional repressor) of toxin-antitoxin stability system
MTMLSIRKVRAALGRRDEILAREGEVLVTRRGRPVARLVPVHAAGRTPSQANLRARMPRLKDPSEVLVRQDRDGLRVQPGHSVQCTPKPSAQDIRLLKGIIRSGKRRAVSVEGMPQAIAEGFSRS